MRVPPARRRSSLPSEDGCFAGFFVVWFIFAVVWFSVIIWAIIKVVNHFT